MAKDKRKKKYFQGLEHLKAQAVNSNTENVQVDEKLVIGSQYLRGDLIRVVILVFTFLLVLTGLTILDKKTDILTNLAHKIASLVIK